MESSMRFTRTKVVLAAGPLAVATTAIPVVLAAGSATAGTRTPERAVSVPGGELYAVAATSASSAWAVGGSDNPPGKTEILHWNGTAWKRVPSPTPKTGGALFGVAATSASSAWAVGCAGNCFQGFGGIKTLILHWNGTAWKRVPSPGLAKVGALNGIAATSASNAWAVGCAGHCFGPMATTKTMTVRWNGTAWKQVPSPSPAGDSVLTAVAATSTGNAWAVGYTRKSGKTLIERWNGTAWKQVPSPTPGPLSQLLGVAATSARNAWAAGSDLSGLIL